MKLVFSKRAFTDYENLTGDLRKMVHKQLNFLIKNFRHPSLHAKKFDESKDVWQARITKNWRFYFQIRGNIYYIVTIIRHPK